MFEETFKKSYIATIINMDLAVAYAGKKFPGVQGYGRPRRGWGRRSPPPGLRRIFENLQRIPLENCKNAVFSPILQTNFKTQR